MHLVSLTGRLYPGLFGIGRWQCGQYSRSLLAFLVCEMVAGEMENFLDAALCEPPVANIHLIAACDLDSFARGL
jgi:hypothetical protein